MALDAADVEKLLPSEDRAGWWSRFFNLANAKREAGRATGLAQAFDVKPSSAVSLPKTHSATSQLSSAGIGAGGMGLLAALLTKGRAAAAGAALGGLGGAIHGGISHANKMGDEVDNIKSEVLKRLASGQKAKADIGQGSLLAAILGGTGVHQSGRADVVDTVRGKEPEGENRLPWLDPLYGIGHVRDWLNSPGARDRIAAGKGK